MLETYQPEGEAEAADVPRVRALLERSPDPYPRSLPMHVTGSALVVHPDSGRVDDQRRPGEIGRAHV